MQQNAAASVVALLGMLLACPGTAHTTPVIGISTVVVSGAPNQQVQFFVSGGDLVSGLNFYMQIGDGGPNNFGSDAGPLFTAVDLETGTIFDGNNSGQVDTGSLLPDLMAFFTINTLSGSVSANGLIATITLDGTGFVGVNMTYRLTNVADQAFGGTGLDSSFVVSSVPEPATLALLALGLAAIGVARRKTSKSA